MKTILIRQITDDGRSRMWRLRPESSPASMGSSRRARLSSLDQTSAGVDGVFEFHNDVWSYISMTNCDLEFPDQVLHNETEIRLGESKLQIALHEKDTDLYDKLLNKVAPGSDYEMEIARIDERVIFTQIVKAGSKESAKTLNYRKIMGQRLLVSRTPIALAEAETLLKQNFVKGMDKESRRGLALVAVCALTFSVIAAFGPKTQMDISAMNFPPPTAHMMFKPSVPKQAMAKVKAAAAPAETPKKQTNDAPKGGKIAGLLKGLSGGRLSKLMGKVSSQAARSREVVIQNGIKANEGSSTVAIASMGPKSNWAQAAHGDSITVSTAGRGGGRGVAGLGNLSAGTTGQAGVGLIEEESDISGGLDREVIAQTIKTYLGQILYCYERQLSAHPDLFGKIAVRFTIGPSGLVESEKIGDTTLRNATVEGCILNKVAAWKFPTPQGGTKVVVTYPFLFKSTN